MQKRNNTFPALGQGFGDIVQNDKNHQGDQERKADIDQNSFQLLIQIAADDSFNGEDQQVAAVKARYGEEIDNPQLQGNEGDEHEKIGKTAHQHLLGNVGDLHGPGQAFNRNLALDDLLEGVKSQEHEAAGFLDAVFHGGGKTVMDLGGGVLHGEADEANAIFTNRGKLNEKKLFTPFIGQTQ